MLSRSVVSDSLRPLWRPYLSALRAHLAKVRWLQGQKLRWALLHATETSDMASAAAFLSTLSMLLPHPGWEPASCQSNREVTVMERTPGCERSCWGYRASRLMGALACSRLLRTSWVFLIDNWEKWVKHELSLTWQFLWSIYYAPSTIWNYMQGRMLKMSKMWSKCWRKFIGVLPRKQLKCVKLILN